jgi:hypothetical protein
MHYFLFEINEINNCTGFRRQNNLIYGIQYLQYLEAVLRIWVQKPVLYSTPGSGIGFIRIPDPQSIFLRA